MLLALINVRFACQQVDRAFPFRNDSTRPQWDIKNAINLIFEGEKDGHVELEL